MPTENLFICHRCHKRINHHCYYCGDGKRYCPECWDALKAQGKLKFLSDRNKRLQQEVADLSAQVEALHGALEERAQPWHCHRCGEWYTSNHGQANPLQQPWCGCCLKKAELEEEGDSEREKPPLNNTPAQRMWQ